MATKTFNPAGSSDDWSNAAAWTPSAPADGDDVVIASGKICNFDVDLSAWTGLTGVNITGTLQPKAAAGTYVLKLASGTITGTGSLLAGTSSVPLASNISFTIQCGGGYVNGASGLTVELYGNMPTNKYALITTQVAAVDQVINIDRDLTSDWQVGDSIFLAYGQTGVLDETISGLTSSTLTLTNPAGQIFEKGMVIAFAQCNVTVTCSNQAFNTCTNAVWQCLIRGDGTGYALKYNISSTMSGLLLHNLTGTMTAQYETISGLICGNHTGVASSRHGIISGASIGHSYYCVRMEHATRISGRIGSCRQYGLSECYYVDFSGTLQYCLKSAIYRTTCDVRQTATISDNIEYDIAHSSNVTLYGTSLDSTNNIYAKYGTKVQGYGTSLNGTFQCVDYIGAATNQVAILGNGTLKAWSGGGRIASQAVVGTEPFTKTWVHVSTFEDVNYPNFVDVPVWCDAAASIRILLWVKLSSLGMTGRLQAQLIDPEDESVLESVQAADSTSWQSLNFVASPTRTGPYILRITGTHGSGTAQWNYQIDPLPRR